MEFRETLNVFIRRKNLAFGIVLLIVAGAYVWAYVQPVRYTTSMSFSVNRLSRQSTPDYQFDGYYALQAADLFSQTIVSWLQTPSVLVEIYDSAGITTPVHSIRSLTSRFKTKKYSSQNIVVTFSAPSQEEAKRLATAITDVITARAKDVNRTTDDQSIFELTGSPPVIVKADPSPLLIGSISLVVGIVLALFLVPLVEYLGPARRPAL